jgi:hypothetical protein
VKGGDSDETVLGAGEQVVGAAETGPGSPRNALEIESCLDAVHALLEAVHVGAGRRRESLDERERGKEHGEYRFLSGDDHEDLLFLQMSPRGTRVGSRRQLCDRRSSAALGVTD